MPWVRRLWPPGVELGWTRMQRWGPWIKVKDICRFSSRSRDPREEEVRVRRRKEKSRLEALEYREIVKLERYLLPSTQVYSLEWLNAHDLSPSLRLSLVSPLIRYYDVVVPSNFDSIVLVAGYHVRFLGEEKATKQHLKAWGKLSDWRERVCDTMSKVFCNVAERDSCETDVHEAMQSKCWETNCSSTREELGGVRLEVEEGSRNRALRMSPPLISRRKIDKERFHDM